MKKFLFIAIATAFIGTAIASTDPPVYEPDKESVTIKITDSEFAVVDLQTLEVFQEYEGFVVDATKVLEGSGKYSVAIKTTIEDCEFLFVTNPVHIDPGIEQYKNLYLTQEGKKTRPKQTDIVNHSAGGLPYRTI